MVSMVISILRIIVWCIITVVLISLLGVLLGVSQ